jgi:hypothetical protein
MEGHAARPGSAGPRGAAPGLAASRTGLAAAPPGDPVGAGAARRRGLRLRGGAGIRGGPRPARGVAAGADGLAREPATVRSPRACRAGDLRPAHRLGGARPPVGGADRVPLPLPVLRDAVRDHLLPGLGDVPAGDRLRRRRPRRGRPARPAGGVQPCRGAAQPVEVGGRARPVRRRGQRGGGGELAADGEGAGRRAGPGGQARLPRQPRPPSPGCSTGASSSAA